MRQRSRRQAPPLSQKKIDFTEGKIDFFLPFAKIHFIDAKRSKKLLKFQINLTSGFKIPIFEKPYPHCLSARRNVKK